MKIVAETYVAIKDRNGNKRYLSPGTEIEQPYDAWTLSQVCKFVRGVTVLLRENESLNFYCHRYAPREYCTCLQSGRIKLNQIISSELASANTPESVSTTTDAIYDLSSQETVQEHKQTEESTTEEVAKEETETSSETTSESKPKRTRRRS